MKDTICIISSGVWLTSSLEGGSISLWVLPQGKKGFSIKPAKSCIISNLADDLLDQAHIIFTWHCLFLMLTPFVFACPTWSIISVTAEGT